MAVLTRMTVTVSSEEIALTQGLLALYAPSGWEESLSGDNGCQFVVYSAHPGFSTEFIDLMKRMVPKASLDLENFEEQDWQEAWKEFFTPVDGGEHFLVLAPWMHEELRASKRIPLIIEPKMAFGTGHHPSTALCLDIISFLAANALIAPGMRFFDLGTGSGILGIACAKLGLRGLGVDIDGPSVENALENRAINCLQPDCFAIQLGGIEMASGVYHLVTANILAAPLHFMAPELVACVATRESFGVLPPLPRARESGWLILSGLLSTQVADIEKRYADLGMTLSRRFDRGEWAGLLFGG